MYSLLRRKAEGFNGNLIDFAARLVQTAGSSFDEDAVANLVEKEMRALGYASITRDGAGNVAGLLPGRSAHPTVLLTSHMDTVEPPEPGAWRLPVHGGVLAGGRLHGCGAADCKAGLAAQVYAGALLRRSLLPMDGTVVVAATVAEEAGGSAGVRELTGNLLPAMGIRPDFVVLGEPTRLGLYYGHDGHVEVEIRVHGTDAAEVNVAAQAIYADLSRQGKGFRARTAHREDLVVNAPRFRGDGGVRQATLVVNRRVHAAAEVDTVLDQLHHNAALVARSAGAVSVHASVRTDDRHLYTGRTTVVRHVRDAWTTDPFHPLLERARLALAAAGCRADPGRWELGRLGMGTAGGVFVNEFNIPVIGYGPGDEAMAHAVDESVDIAAIGECMYGTAAITHALAGVPVFGWTQDDP